MHYPLNGSSSLAQVSKYCLQHLSESHASMQGSDIGRDDDEKKEGKEQTPKKEK